MLHPHGLLRKLAPIVVACASALPAPAQNPALGDMVSLRFPNADVRDVLALENTQAFRGRYHVLGGLISPMDGMGPNDLKIDHLLERVSAEGSTEVVFALSTTMEGDTTAFYLYRRLQPTGVKLTVIARGLPLGDALEYADERTLSRAVEQRVPYEQTIKG